MDTTSKRELSAFIENSMSNRKTPYKRIKIGDISEAAQSRIKNKFGFNIPGIGIENYSIIHTMKKAAHNLESDDLLHAVDVINTSQNIELSPKQHKDCKVLEFTKDINGELTILTEVHTKDGYLLVFDAWRKKKARRDTTADTGEGTPSVNVQNETPLADTPLSPSSSEKSRK
jgi:hypothetical protein